MKHLIRAFSVNIFKTLIINFKYFNVSDTLKFPIILGWDVSFVNLKGSVKVIGTIKAGLIFIKKNHLDINGEWILKGETRLNGGTDSFVFVGVNGRLETGSRFYTNGTVAINCVKSVKIGDDCLFAHQIEIFDTDFHKITSLDGIHKNPDREVLIGDRVWIGSNTLILKGVKIIHDTIIAAGSVVSRDCNIPNSIYGGVPATLIKEEVRWEL